MLNNNERNHLKQKWQIFGTHERHPVKLKANTKHWIQYNELAAWQCSSINIFRLQFLLHSARNHRIWWHIHIHTMNFMSFKCYNIVSTSKHLSNIFIWWTIISKINFVPVCFFFVPCLHASFSITLSNCSFHPVSFSIHLDLIECVISLHCLSFHYHPNNNIENGNVFSLSRSPSAWNAHYHSVNFSIHPNTHMKTI